MLNKFLVFVCVLFMFPFGGWATHNRAGEITYEHISGLTYKITITTYTNSTSVQADRCELPINFGDGVQVMAPRVNGSPCSGGEPPCNQCGQNIGGNIKKNLYTVTHTYPSTGSYFISVSDPNRNQGVVNIPNSVNVEFYLYSELIIFPDGRPNSSPVLTYPPVDNGCLFTLYEHNPGAVDNDISKTGESDSLTYSLVECRGAGGTSIPGYSFPDQHPAGANNQISIDAQTGTITWDAPQRKGEYNIAILIEEWRTINGVAVRVGSVLRDLQVYIDECRVNNPPKITPVADTCVSATELLNKEIEAIDNDFLPPGFTEFQTVTLKASGDPFYVVGNQASFTERSGKRRVVQDFNWRPNCNAIRPYPYFVVFRAQDNHPDVRLSDYQDWRINVLAPSPEGLNAEPLGAAVNLTWAYPKCTNATGFDIYRKIDSLGYVAPACVTGVPASTGYVKIGNTVGINSNFFKDDENGLGLTHGQRYCYMIVATFENGSESYPSTEACAVLKKEVAVLTRVSVNTTSNNAGSDSIEWSKPTELDLIQFPGPYQYRVLRGRNVTSFQEIFMSNSDADITNLDTIYVDNNLNTSDIQYYYKIEVYSNGELVGPSRAASSPYLRAKPLDNRLELNVNVNVPWSNYKMQVYRKDAAGNYTFLDSIASNIYTDSNLVNGREFCYYVVTYGQYSDTSIIRPIMNNSQQLCAIPEDNQAPCAPQNLELDSQCELFYNGLTWLNPNDICDTTDDVVRYNVYYKETQNGTYYLYDSILGAQNTQIKFEGLNSVAGCYYVTAVDSFNNESLPSNEVCADNCPYYELPNIFTPGTDGMNDEFKPFAGWRYVERVDMKVFNRWGDLVYETTDPDLGWDGTKDGSLFPNTAYFYVCTVYEITLEGIKERVLKGTITIQREDPSEQHN